MDMIIAKLAVVGIAGIGSQWLAWRFRIPGIVLLAVAGLMLGPVTEFIVPERDFGRLFKPMVAVAVAIILFEGGFTLNFSEIRHTSTAVRRLVTIGAPLAWILNTAAAHYVAGLPFAAAVILGGVLVVTGPTVIMPLLRQSNLSHRPASLLRWEAIVNDPVGALFAVLAFETMIVARAGGSLPDLVLFAAFALLIAIGGGILLGRALTWAFNHGLVPEYLKAPVLLVVVLAAYAVSQLILEESGLLTVTVLGITLANSGLADVVEIRRFKETVTVLLVSGVFVLLSASIDASVLAALDWRAAAFVAVMLFVVRPLTTWTATIGSGLSWQERALIGWIAPRGVVAIAVASFFASSMTTFYFDGGRQMIALSFAMVMTTVVLHGFTLGPLARWLGLAAADKNGVVIIGGNPWSVGLAQKLKEQRIPVLIVDHNWNQLRPARAAGIETYYGDILSETAEFTLDLSPYGKLIAATDNDAYNTLVCSDYTYEFGRANVFQLSPAERKAGVSSETLFLFGGRALQASQANLLDVARRTTDGTPFSSTRLTEKYGFNQLRESKGPAWVPVLAVKADRKLEFATADKPFSPKIDDVVLGH